MWLIALYSFLIISALVALLLFGALGWSLRHGLRAALLLIVPSWILANCAFAYAVHRTAYSLEGHDPFCVSCHLHEDEFTRFRRTTSSVALDLAGYHWRKGEGFTCISCHVGEGVEGRAHVLYFAGMTCSPIPSATTNASSPA